MMDPVLPALVLALAVHKAIPERLDASFSGDRQRAAYAFGRLYDPADGGDHHLYLATSRDASEQVRISLLRGMCDRVFAGDPPKERHEAILAAFEHPEPLTRLAGADCIERLPHAEAVELVRGKLDDARGAGLAPALVVSLLEKAGVLGDAKPLADPARGAAQAMLGISPVGGAARLDLVNTRAIASLAELGVDVEPLLAEPPVKGLAPDFFRIARVNCVHAGTGDAAALSALIENARTAVDPKLRREAMAMLVSLPMETRHTALLALASSLSDADPLVRAMLIGELTKRGADDGVEPLLVAGLDEPDAELRFEIAAALADRAAASRLSPEGRAAIVKHAEADALVSAALEAALRLSPAPAESPGVER
jgi:hypothetical protein